MKVVAFDTETVCFSPGRMAPPLVCVSWATPDDSGLAHVKGFSRQLLEEWLAPDTLLVGHHICYDLAVVGAQWPDLVKPIFDKYDRDEIACTKIRQQLLDIAAGQFRGRFVDHKKKDGTISARWVPHGYSLDDLTYRCAGRRLDKDTWRMRYGEFMDLPLGQWPEGAKQYPVEDAKATLDVFLNQEKHVEFIPDQFRQARASWARHLTSVWGLRTHGPGVDALERETVAALAGIEEGLRQAGLVRHNGSRDTKAAKKLMMEVCARDGITLRLTDKGGVSLDSDACTASGDDLLEDYAELTSLKNVLVKDIPVLRAGTQFPVHTSFGMAASGRSTSSKPNVQNPRRLPGIREAFVPRPGKVFAQADFSALELHTLAQVCVTLFGRSSLADVLNGGKDPHTDFAASILGISYDAAMQLKKDGDEKLDNARQTAKVANFGFPGGLGYEKLVLFARKMHSVILTTDQAKELKTAWIARWPEMQQFFAYVSGLVSDDSGEATIRQIFSERWWGGCHYTAAANSFFQGLGADAGNRALYLVSRCCYTQKNNVIYGSRPVNWVHDEVILETEDSPDAHDVAHELSRLMVAGANEFLPDVPARAEPLLARCWSKKAKPVLENGRLVPWAP